MKNPNWPCQGWRLAVFVMTSGELVRSLIAAGFDVRGMYGDTADSAFRPGSPRLLLVAERK